VGLRKRNNLLKELKKLGKTLTYFLKKDGKVLKLGKLGLQAVVLQV
jgi:hypothetical protein